jgi:ribosome-associated protein|tara:strand:+ start:206 stop:559 length:354 start_codon:yes stop_codon:yes gene_type:complete
MNEDMMRTAADLVVDTASEIQAENIHLLDVRGVSEFSDYFVILSTLSPRHMRAVSIEIEGTLKTNGVSIHHKEGDHNSGWSLLDYGDLIIHLFAPDSRDFYDLESAWPDAKTLRIIQ